MREDGTTPPRCCEEFSELCALSTTDALTTEERRRLGEHVLECRRCATRLAEYQRVAGDGMARIGAELQMQEFERFESGTGWDQERARRRLLSTVGASAAVATPQRSQRAFTAKHPRIRRVVRRAVGSPSVRAAAMVVLGAFLAYHVGLRRGASLSVPPPALVERQAEDARLHQQLARLESEREALQQKLREVSTTTAALEEQASQAETRVTDLQQIKASLEIRTGELSAREQEQSASLHALAADHEALQQKLLETEKMLTAVRHDLTLAQDERQKGLLRASTLETEIDHLTAQLHEGQASSQRKEQLLASDRDVRELMGARQLYIADVFDIDPQGKTKKPFGRVFYTKGTSLIFYAFDLDQQPGYREARAFQGWGRPGASQSQPVSLGIFYMDNESNRRWALKFDDPKVLEEINAVFVTVEPAGGSRKPTNKPFLLAYLHTAPANHP